jgi:hypothetical protein
VDPVEEALAKLGVIEDPYTVPVTEAMVALLMIKDSSDPSHHPSLVTQPWQVEAPEGTIFIESVKPVAKDEPETISYGDPLRAGGPNVEVGMLSLEGWSGSAAILTPVGAAVLVSTRAVQSTHLERADGTFTASNAKEGTYQIPRTRLVVWESDGGVQRAVWHVYGAVEQLTGGWDKPFAPSEPFAKVTGPVLVRLFWSREGHPDVTGDLVSKKAVAERLGLLTERGPEFTLTGA